MLTAWDGYTRVDYLPDPGRVRVTLLTVEPLVHHHLRPGLACAFVDGDATGPPAYVEVDRWWGDTEAALLGESLMALINGMAGTAPRSRNIRLALNEVAQLADRWAPYRGQVLGTDCATCGSWADGLWTWFGTLGFARLVRELPLTAEPAYRGNDDTAELDWRELVLPAELAAEAGVSPVTHWVGYRQQDPFGTEETGVVIRATVRHAPTARLLVGLDDEFGTWVELEPDPDDPAVLVADLPVSPHHDEPALRFRTDRKAHA